MFISVFYFIRTAINRGNSDLFEMISSKSPFLPRFNTSVYKIVQSVDAVCQKCYIGFGGKIYACKESTD
jgi:hypothetical protein